MSSRAERAQIGPERIVPGHHVRTGPLNGVGRLTIWESARRLSIRLLDSAIHALSRWTARFTANSAYRVRHGLAEGLKRRGGLGFLAPRSPLTREEAFLAGLDLTGQTVYDIGGYQGLYALFFARAVGPQGRVIVFEPLLENVTAIEHNLAINEFTHSSVEPVGVGAVAGVIDFVVPQGSPGATTGYPPLQAAYNAASHGRSRTFRAQVLSLDDLQLPTPQLIKIDVEGMEADVLRGARRLLTTHHPAVFVELHGPSASDKIANALTVIRLLLDAGYSVRQVESGVLIDPAQIVWDGSSHLYATA